MKFSREREAKGRDHSETVSPLHGGGGDGTRERRRARAIPLNQSQGWEESQLQEGFWGENTETHLLKVSAV